MAGWSAWHWMVDAVLLAWLVALTLRMRMQSRRLAVHVCREPDFPMPAGAADPDRHAGVDQSTGVYELIDRVEQSRQRAAARPATVAQADPEQTARIRGAPPRRPSPAAGRRGELYPLLGPALQPAINAKSYRSGDQR